MPNIICYTSDQYYHMLSNMNSRNSKESIKEDQRSYGSFNQAEENVTKVEISDESKSVDKQRKCVVIITLLVVLAAIVVTLVVYFTLGQHDQVILHKLKQ